MASGFAIPSSLAQVENVLRKPCTVIALTASRRSVIKSDMLLIGASALRGVAGCGRRTGAAQELLDVVDAAIRDDEIVGRRRRLRARAGRGETGSDRGLFHARIDEKAMRMINRTFGVLVMLCGLVVLVPVYSVSTGGGNNGQYTILMLVAHTVLIVAGDAERLDRMGTG